MNIGKVVLIFLLTILMVGMVSAVNLNVEFLRVNGEKVSLASGHSDNLEVQRGEELDLKMKVKALADVEDVQIRAEIFGYRYAHYEGDMVSDVTRTFDLAENDTTYKTLSLQIPTKMDKKYAKLRVTVGDEDGTSYENVYELHIIGVDEEDAIMIKDVSINPSNEVMAGRAFTAMVKVKNIGDDELDDIKVTIAVPELGVTDTEYIDELDPDESETFEKLLIRIPDCAEAGTYTVEVEVEFDEYESTTETVEIVVVEGETCSPLEEPDPCNVEKAETPTITSPGMQDVVKGGSGAVFPIMITNTGKYSKTYVVSVSGVASWGTAKLDPSSLVMVKAGTTETVYVYVTANNDAPEGQRVFKVNVESDTKSTDVALTANVVSGSAVAGSSTGLRKALEIALIVLVVILIILGLIIGFNKLKGNREDDEEEQTYY